MFTGCDKREDAVEAEMRSVGCFREVRVERSRKKRWTFAVHSFAKGLISSQPEKSPDLNEPMVNKLYNKSLPVGFICGPFVVDTLSVTGDGCSRQFKLGSPTSNRDISCQSHGIIFRVDSQSRP